METITTNTKTLELTGEEVHIHFTAGYPYFWLRNDGTYTVQMSLSPNISEGKDGVIEVPAGSSAGTMHGYDATRSDLYLVGNGKIQVMGTYTPENPFRKAQKGGGGNNLLPHSNGLIAYFTYSNVSETGWVDIVGKTTIAGNFNSGNDFVSPEIVAEMPILLNNPYTAYIIFKQNVPNSEWYGVFNTPENHFGIYENNNEIGVFNPKPYGTPYMSGISSLNYHVCAITFYNGLGSLYIDGVLRYTRTEDNLSDILYVIHGIANYKMIALCDNTAHSSADILENTRYLAQKYGIEI